MRRRTSPSPPRALRSRSEPLRGLLALALALAFAFALARPAAAIERNFAGSAQLDYSFVPSARDAKAFPQSFDGFTMEFAGKLAIDFSEKVSANVKVCFGCHGLEADMMYFDYRVADELNFRVGRFSPSFGSFNLRHDPANHRLSDKPLPYDMGRMLRMRQWNQGVLPSPFPDNGIEIDGTHYFGDSAQLDYAVYAVAGFKADARPLDIDFRLSRSPQNYYIDNNARPTMGGRVAFTVALGEGSDLTAGASGMYGTYDPDNQLAYAIVGGDVSVRLKSTVVRLEYLARRTEFDLSDKTQFRYLVPPTGGDFFVKHGAYFEVEQAVNEDLDLIGRLDGLARIGNVADASELDRRSGVVRGTLGLAYAIERGLRIKFSTELWGFSDADGVTGRKTELSSHLGLAGSF